MLHVVIGAFGFSGQYIAKRLLAAGERVRALTNSPCRSSPLQGKVAVAPLCFDDPDRLAMSLEGADVLYNTYWVRFNHSNFTHSEAVTNTRILFAAAKCAGVRKVVHVSITNPDEHSPLEYFAGKGRLERDLKESGLNYAILRPAVLFGPEDILINNIAWGLRRFPVFAVFGDGQYQLQPIFVDDFAALAVREGLASENRVVEAIGPECFTYESLVRVVGCGLGISRPLVQVPPLLGYGAAKLIGWWMKDRLLTREEIAGLMAGLLHVEAPPAGQTRLSEWVGQNAHRLGREYASELGRRRDRNAAYGKW
jgi:NADH dehydrogenase